MSNKGAYSVIEEIDESKLSTEELNKKIKKLKTELTYKKAGYGLLKGAIASPKIVHQIYDTVDTRNKEALLDWNPKGKNVVNNGRVQVPFADRAGHYSDGIVDTLFTNTIKNSSRVPVQRVKIRNNVIKDDFYNYWAENMANNENSEISKVFQSVIPKWKERIKEGKFSINEVAKFYGSEEYNRLLETKDFAVGTGVDQWATDIANFGGIEGYIKTRAEEWDMDASDLHYMFTRDGTYDVLPTVDTTKFTTEDWSKLNLNRKTYKSYQTTMNPKNFNDWNLKNENLFAADMASNVSIDTTGKMSVSGDYLNSEEYLNLPKDFKKDLDLIDVQGINVDDLFAQGIDESSDEIADVAAEELDEVVSGTAKEAIDVAGDVVGAGFDVATLADDDADTVEKTLAAAGLTQSALAAASVATGPAGPIIAGLGLLYNMSKSNEGQNVDSQLLAQINSLQEDIEDYDKSGEYSALKGLV